MKPKRAPKRADSANRGRLSEIRKPPTRRGRPFRLKQHMVVSKKRLENLAGCEVVSELADHVIVRLPTPLPPPVPVRSEDDQLESSARAAVAQTGLGKDRQAFKSYPTIEALKDKGDFVTIKAIAWDAIATLAQYARAGNQEALGAFVSMTCEAATGLSQMTKENPGAMQSLARKRTHWPLMKSLHPHSSDPDKLLGEIKLGADVPANFWNGAKWKSDEAALIAADLLEFLWALQAESRHHILPDGRHVTVDELLPLPQGDHAPAWWEAAEMFLLLSYPDPTAVPELAAACKTPSWQKPKSRKKQGILNAIKARFTAICQTG